MAKKKTMIENLQTPEEFIPERRKKIQDLIEKDNELEEISFLPSQFLKKEEKKKEKVYVEETEEAEDTSEWMSALAELKKPSTKVKPVSDFFKGQEFEGAKKKKKKKKKDGEPINYEEEFERETAIIRNLLQEQTKFTNSLQQRYNILDQQKSSARGVGKFTTDLIGAINGARSLSKDLAKELINTKKTVCELNIKERDRLSKKNDDTDSLGYASKYLKSLISTNRGEFINGNDDIDDIESGDEMFSDIMSSMEGNDNYVARSDESNRYLKYENEKVTIHVSCTQTGEDPVFYAVNEAGDVLDDYPVPTFDKVTVNPSTMIAIDKYGEKYPASFR